MPVYQHPNHHFMSTAKCTHSYHILFSFMLKLNILSDGCITEAVEFIGAQLHQTVFSRLIIFLREGEGGDFFH